MTRRKLINGVMHKLCSANKSHTVNVWLPETTAYFSRRQAKSDGWNSRCKDCDNTLRVQHTEEKGYVPTGRLKPLLLEIEARVGRMGAARETGLNRTTIENVVNGKNRHMQKRKAKLVIATARRLRESNVVLHRNDILHGSVARGKQPKRVPEKPEDYYRNVVV